MPPEISKGFSVKWQIAEPDPIPEPLVRYPALVPLPVVWGNLDALGHVNNTASIRWFESGRVALLERMGVAEIMQGESLGPILAAVNCHYRRQIHYPDTVVIGSRVSQWGRTSLTVEHVIYSLRQEHIATEGESVIVIFNYQTQRPVRIPDHFREAVVRMQVDEPPVERARGTNG
jgi:acyl-CoA thioester hydrolase